MELQGADDRGRYLIRDRDGKYPALFDSVLADAGIQGVFAGVRMPRMNSIMERWVQTCRHERLDRTLIWNQRHLLHALHEYEQFYNSHRPHQGLGNTRPRQPLPQPITDSAQISRLDIGRRPRLGGILNEYQPCSLTRTDDDSANAASKPSASPSRATPTAASCLQRRGDRRRPGPSHPQGFHALPKPWSRTPTT